MTQLVFMLYFLFFRIIESKALEVLTGSKDTRYRLVAKAEESRYIKRIVIKKRSDRTTHAITIFLLTKAGLRYLTENMPGELFSGMSKEEIDKIQIFGREEYSDDARLRIAGGSTAMIMAIAAKAVVPIQVFTKDYLAQTDIQNHSDNCEVIGLKRLIQRRLTQKIYDDLGIFGSSRDHQNTARYYDAAFIKQIVAGTQDPLAERDFYKGRFKGVICSHSRSVLVYTAPVFGMPWPEWVVKDEISNLLIWNKKYVSYQGQILREPSAVLIVKNHRQFINLLKDVDGARKSKEVFGGRFHHLFIIEESLWGAAMLRWLMEYSDERVTEGVMKMLENKQVAKHNIKPTRRVFAFRTIGDREGAIGYTMDAKMMLEVANWAEKRPAENFVVLCTEPEYKYFAEVMPDNVTIMVQH